MRKTGLLDYIFKSRKIKQFDSYFKMLNGYSPVFTSFSGGVYEMDLTRTAINNFATHCSKLKPEIEGSALARLRSTLQYKPNMLMDTSKFIARIATILETEHTAFIVPIEDNTGSLIGWYPIHPQMCELVEYKGIAYLRYTFGTAVASIELERVGIMTSHQYKDELFGEANTTLAPTLQLMHTTNEGIINAVKSSANIRFMARVANMLKDTDLQRKRDQFAEQNLSGSNKSGILLYDSQLTDLKQIDSKPYTPNALQIQQIQENVCTHFGTNMNILQNKFSEDEWNAYYEGKIEPFALQLSLIMTNMSYSQREKAQGNAIYFSANRLQYASNSTKLNVSTQLFDRGLITRNQVFDIWNMPNIEDGDKYYIRKEYAELLPIKEQEEDIREGKEEENADSKGEGIQGDNTAADSDTGTSNA